jgi:hypothetical protein
MDCTNTNPVEQKNPFDPVLAPARGGEETCFDMARSCEIRLEHDADSERFQRYETSRKQSVKRNEQRAIEISGGNPKVASSLSDISFLLAARGQNLIGQPHAFQNSSGPALGGSPALGRFLPSQSLRF